MARITGLTVYPVKSCRGIELAAAELTETGLRFDRHWMVVDATGRFLSQRTLPRMALIRTMLTQSQLVLTAEDRPPLSIPLEHSGQPVRVQVWNDICDGFDGGDEAADWFSAFLGGTARLVRFDPAFRRPADPGYTGGPAALSAFSDGFPLLLISQASLDDLNGKLPRPLPMNRFRPNVVVDGIGAFEEDYIGEFSAPGLRLRPVKACTRCAITTTDQDTAHRGVEPLLTLSAYRNNERLDGIAFGQNVLIVEGVGEQLRVGDELAVEWNF